MCALCNEATEVTEVKVCPKCGKTHRVVSGLLGNFYVVCRGCRIETPIAPTKEEAIRLWNQGVFE